MAKKATHRQSRYQGSVEHILVSAGPDGVDPQEARIILKNLTGHLMKAGTMTSLLGNFVERGLAYVASDKRAPYYADSNYKKHVYISKHYASGEVHDEIDVEDEAA